MSDIKSNYTQEIILPSKGYLNPEIPDGKIIQRCMMVTDQKFLSGSNLSGSTLTNALLERTIEYPKDLDIGKLTTADTLYLLFKLRILSYGEIYKTVSRCPICGERLELEVDLSKIEVNYLEEDYTKDLEIELPRAGDTVYTKFLTNDDIQYIKDEMDRRKRKYGVVDDSDFILRLSTMISKVELKKANKDGDKVLTHPTDIQMYVEKLTDLDATAIISTTENIEYGINPLVEERCPNCRNYVEAPITLGAGFFRPKYDNKSRKSSR